MKSRRSMPAAAKCCSRNSTMSSRTGDASGRWMSMLSSGVPTRKSVVISTAPCSKNTSSRRSSRPVHTVEDREQRPDDAGLVLDGARSGVLDVVAEHLARARVHASRSAEQPGQDVGAVDGVLEERAAARTCAIGAPRAVSGHDVARRPVLVVPQDVAHRASELAAEHDGSQLVDHRVKSRVEPDLRGGPGTGDERAHLADGREVGRERLLAQQGLSCGERGAHEIEMGRRRGDDGHRVDFGIVDHRARIRTDRFERADALRGAHGIFGEVGGRHRTDLAVLGEQPECVGVALSDHAAADEADRDGFLAERRGHAADRVRKRRCGAHLCAPHRSLLSRPCPPEHVGGAVAAGNRPPRTASVRDFGRDHTPQTDRTGNTFVSPGQETTRGRQDPVKTADFGVPRGDAARSRTPARAERKPARGALWHSTSH